MHVIIKFLLSDSKDDQIKIFLFFPLCFHFLNTLAVRAMYLVILFVCVVQKELSFYRLPLIEIEGVVGWCEGAVYLTSLGRQTDIGLQLGKACYPCSG